MKLLQAPNMKNIELTKAMYTAIHSYDEQAFDISKESGGKKVYREEIVAACSESRHC